MSDTLTIFKRIDGAYAELASMSFTKDKWVGKWIDVKEDGKIVGKIIDPTDKNGYYVVSIRQILSAVQNVHAKWGIKVFFEGPYYDASNSEKRLTVSHKDRYGNDVQTVIANGHYDVRIIGSGEDDCISMRVQCEAKDSVANDKLGNKLLTNAMRCLYRSLYSIDGDDSKDPEEVGVEIEVPDIPSREAKAQDAMTDSFFGMTRQEKKAKVLEWIKSNPDSEDLAYAYETYGKDTETWQLGVFVHLYDDVVSKEVKE
ncbi:MAG: hypothetical protein IJV02_00050 [Candidatus Methanomethylophilaceae archaeon]|nr:hypothetical protein [Candidatus Methanomethylophilaceae archaeon]